VDEDRVDQRTAAWPRTHLVAIVVAALALTVVAGGVIAILVASTPSSSTIVETFVYELLPDANGGPDSDDITLTVAVLERRLAGLGAVVRAGDDGTIAIDLLEGADRYVVQALARPQGRVEFIPIGIYAPQPGEKLDPVEFPALFGGESVIDARPLDEGRSFEITLDDDAAGLLADFSAKHVGEGIAITLDSAVVSAPIMKEAIPGGKVLVESDVGSGFQEFDELIRLMSFGPLPFPLRDVRDLGEP
jgi:preprotein translocase subunit SecD